MALALPASAGAAEAKFSAHGSVEQVYVTGLVDGARMSLLDRAGKTVRTRRASELGGLLFRRVKPGEGYRVRAATGGPKSEPLTVLSTKSAPPSEDVYEQEIPESGYDYLTTRDGTKLAIYVHPPEDVSNALPTGYVPHVPAGPTPTLIEYSGYGYANPAGPQSGISIIANLMGFTVVDVNMRGTGCSGGAFDFFEPLQSLDGYDIIETVARQPWVKHGRVGMMGISYGGISQLFTAQTQPPSLAAISPLSLIDQVATTLYPGGILNTGFAFNWAKERAEEARPAGPEAGQEWAYKRIQEGDETCKENQVMHGEAAKLINKVRANDTYRPKVADPLSPITFVDKIKVPTFVACQWTDEQTGGHCPTLASRFTGTDKKWFTFTNGTHVDSLAPETFNRWYDFLMLYVAKDAPMKNQAGIRAAAPLIYDAAMGIDGQTLPPDPIQEEPTYEGALAAFEALDPIRILFDNGAGGDPGMPNPGFEQSFPSFPIPGTAARSWYFGADGSLKDEKPTDAGTDSFTWNAKAGPPTNFSGDTGAGENGLWTASPAYEWQQSPEDGSVSYMTEPLAENTAVIGPGAVQAWVKSSKPSVDLQVVITEVRPDGKETFVQNGWLRAKMRKLDKEKSDGPLAPVLSLRRRDLAPMPAGRFAKLTIPLYYQGHAYRADSRIRVIITDPNGDQPIWSFGESKPKGKVNVSVAHSKSRPSRLILPVVPGVDVPTELPQCPGLRGEPCRDFES
ncbi:MAG: CocE/NonD family hydrolase [Thermoleophilaceae bacterium]